MESEFLTACELTSWLKVKLPTIRRWAREGLPCLRAGRLCRYERNLVRAWLQAREEQKRQEKNHAETHAA